MNILSDRLNEYSLFGFEFITKFQVYIKVSFDVFKSEFINSANKLVGSGYTFLVYKDGSFDIINLPNQENPYTYNYTPLIALDLWEHAYYLTYYNDRALYINNFFRIINFDYANNLYEKIK